MSRTVKNVKTGRRRREVDGRYFCCIGLLERHLKMRIISHESVHAAFCYARRQSRNQWDKLARDSDEEAIAYPAGEITRGIVWFLERKGFIGQKKG